MGLVGIVLTSRLWGEETVSDAVSAICDIDADDGMEYSVERVEHIRYENEYANWRAHLQKSCRR